MAVKNAEGINWNDASVQVKLRLTTDKEILRSRRADRLSWQNTNGKEALVLRYNSREYRFHPGETIAVPAPVAHGLITSSVTIPGEDKISGEMIPALEIVSNWVIGEREPGQKGVAECPECGQVCDTAKELAKHILKEHKEEEVTA